MPRPRDPSQVVHRTFALQCGGPELVPLQVGNVSQGDSLTEHPALVEAMQQGGVPGIAGLKHWDQKLVSLPEQLLIAEVISKLNSKHAAAVPSANKTSQTVKLEKK